MLRGFHPAPIHTLIGAVRGILYGLSRREPNSVLTKWDKSILASIVGTDAKSIRGYQNQVSNFLKHADRDANKLLSGVDLDRLNRMEIQLCIVAYAFYKKDIPATLNVALLYFGRSRDAIFPYSELSKALKIQVSDYERMENFDEGLWRDAILRLIENSKD